MAGPGIEGCAAAGVRRVAEPILSAIMERKFTGEMTNDNLLLHDRKDFDGRIQGQGESVHRLCLSGKGYGGISRKRLNEIKKEHPKATHHCFAYRIGLGWEYFPGQ
jgi:hypothetical protein